MARMPQADWLGEHSPRREMDRYDIVCVHTIVGFAPAHAAHFSTHQGGTIQQSRDTRYRSAANLNGNHRVISIENEDHGSAFPSWGGSNVPALTDAQVEANAQILAWAHKEHGVPLQLCPNSRPNSRGLAYHRQGIDGNFGNYKYGGRTSGGENWSTSFGKVCPGDRRIDQLPAILARAKEIVGGDDMPSAKEVADAVYDRFTHEVGKSEAAVRLGMFKPGETVHPNKALEYAWGYAQLAHHALRGPVVAWEDGQHHSVVHTLSWLQRSSHALMSAQEGLDTPAILARIDQRAAEDAARDQAVLDAVGALESGNADAALRALRDLLDSAVDTDA